MSATIALVRIQLHFMKWPLIVLTGCVIALLIPVEMPKDLIEVGSALFVIIGAVVSGAMMLGEEYAQGADGYLATRPVSPLHALSVKVLMLLIYSVPAAWIVDEGFSFLHPYWKTFEYERMVPLVWGLLFGLSLWCAGAAILTKDTVRGMLYGPLTYFFVCVLVWLLPSPFYKHMGPFKEIEGTIERNYGFGYECQLLDDVLVVSLISLSPILVLALVICVYQYRAKHRVGIPIISVMMILIYMVFYWCAWCSVQCVGTLSTISLGNNNSPFGVDKTHGRIYTAQQHFNPMCQTINIKDLSDPSHIISSLDPLEGFTDDWSYIHDDRFLVLYGKHHGGSTFVEVYPIGGNGDLQEPKRIENEGDLRNIERYDQERILAEDQILDAKGQVVKDANGSLRMWRKLINLRTGMVEVSRVYSPEDFGFIFSYGNLVFKPKTGITDSTIEEFIIQRVKDDLSYEDLGSLPPFGEKCVIDGSMFVYVPCKYDHKRKRNCLSYPWVRICDIRDQSNPTCNVVKFPFSFYTFPNAVLKISEYLGKHLGLEAKSKDIYSDIDSARVALGNGILSIQYCHRVLMWDISDINHPEWLGVAPIGVFDIDRVVEEGSGKNGPKTIIRYPDGALGFPAQERIYRFEFPALMKEAHS